MEDVSFGEFLAWLWSSGAVIWIVLGGLAIKVIRDNINDHRRVQRKMRELGIVDEHGRRIRRDEPPAGEP